MARDLYNRYVWLVDTIRRYGRITRSELDECWLKSPFSHGEHLSRRTFYNYREAVEELFNINIECDTSTYEYFISCDNEHDESVSNWLLNSAVLNDVLSSARDVSQYIFMEDVPSAREFLAPMIDALRDRHPVKFSYHPYTRSQPSPGVIVEPYFLKIFKQRWYVTGRHVQADRVKTYALDRISDLVTLTDSYTINPTFDAETYFRDSFGIVFTQNEVKHIVLRVDPHQAKYFRALPLHRSQNEMVHDSFSLFHYDMRISPDLVQELLSYGQRVTVVSPPELCAMMRNELRQALSQYDSTATSKEDGSNKEENTTAD
jgi:hypothetical protein